MQSLRACADASAAFAAVVEQVCVLGPLWGCLAAAAVAAVAAAAAAVAVAGGDVVASCLRWWWNDGAGCVVRRG